jgi:hypothetical protein
MTHELDFLDPELAFAELGIQLMLSQTLKYNSEVIFMLFHTLWIYQNVINEHHDKLYQALLQVDSESDTLQVSLFLIRVDVVWPVLSKSVELPCVVKYTVPSLLKVRELLQLSVEQTCI